LAGKGVPLSSTKRRRLLSRLGPGLVTGAADDDPSGIGTHSQIGAQFGYALGWTFVLSFPLLAVIQLVAAEIGRVTGRGIAANLRRHYPRPLLWLAVTLLLIANVINLGADLSAMGASLQLLIGGSIGLYTLLFGLFCAGLETFLSYRRYASVLKWTTLSLFAYLGVVAVAGVDWPVALRSFVVPEIHWTSVYLTALVAILGTTISPYLFFWQAAQEIEEEKRTHAKPLYIAPEKAGQVLKDIRDDTLVGMGFSTIISIAIVFATAATLHKSGITTINSAAEAAEALRPVAGSLASFLFAAAIASYFLFPSYLLLITQIFVLAIFALSYDLLQGHGGIVSLGHAAFFGLGAYTAAILARAILSPSALVTAIMSASSTTPFFSACNSSPAPGSASTRKKSVMSATAISDWPTPMVSTSTIS